VDLPSGLRLPKGTQVWQPIWGLHRNEEVWGDDAEQFKPERWIAEDGTEAKLTPQQQMSYMPFGQGRRNCIGQNMARLESLIVLGMMLRRFRFECVPGRVYKHGTSATLVWIGGLHLIPRLRSN